MPTHKEVFSLNLVKSNDWVGGNIRKWYKQVTNINSTNLPNGPISREGLIKLCQNSSISDKECIAAVMAWGGQHRGHGRKLFNRIDEVTPIVNKLRKNKLDRFSAYEQFHQIWLMPLPLGMGASYFTKLIYFCSPENNGYIMDQWTAKSSNLIFDEFIIMRGNAIYKHRDNDVKTYEKFCAGIEQLSKELNLASDLIEMSMHSKGGKNPREWRQYVLDNHSDRTAL